LNHFTPIITPAAFVLGRAYSDAVRRATPASVEDLREATATLVTRLKDKGSPPERVVVVIKDALTRYGATHVPPSFEDPGDAFSARETAAYRRVFGWFLDAYYGVA
jgi:hypothetical protein